MSNNKQAKQERSEFGELDVATLKERLENEQKALWKLKFDLGKRQLQDTAEISNTRKRIARIHTYLRQLELKQEAGT
ncbi:MAG: 50S ribosomal protein L29 [Capsulimonadales bacterium]|nr:50S ribosomal protein L29 [Capsulimonadales bacterium]